MTAQLFSRLKLFIKHLLGRDLFLKPDRCMPTVYYGSRYGGWALPKGFVNADSVVYSVGIGEDASFDLALIEVTGSVVHGFDPTPKSLRWVEENIRNPRFIMHPWALGPENGQLELWLPKNPDHVSASCRPSEAMSTESFLAECKSLPTIMKELGHTRVDVLKMDIEGAEYQVIRSLIDSGTLESIGCLLVEFHHWMPAFENRDTREIIALLRSHNFLMHWVSETGHEILFSRPI